MAKKKHTKKELEKLLTKKDCPFSIPSLCIAAQIGTHVCLQYLSCLLQYLYIDRVTVTVLWFFIICICPCFPRCSLCMDVQFNDSIQRMWLLAKLVESIISAHNKLKVAPTTQPRALSIVQGRGVGISHYLLGARLCAKTSWWSFEKKPQPFQNCLALRFLISVDAF